MATKDNQPRQGTNNNDFGLPQAEFKPIAAGGSQWLKITIIILAVVLVIGGGIVYWFFFRASANKPTDETQIMQEEYESEVSESDVDFIDDEAAPIAQPKSKATEKRGRHEREDEDALEGEDYTQDDLDASPPNKPTKGTLTKVASAQGAYYVVVGSFIDDDLAADYAQKLVKKGVDVMLIAPPQGKYFSRVAVAQEDSFYEASERAEELKATYGPSIWVMKY